MQSLFDGVSQSAANKCRIFGQMKIFDNRRSDARRPQNLDLTLHLGGVDWSVRKNGLLLLQKRALASVNYDLSFSGVDGGCDPQICHSDSSGNQSGKQNDEILSPQDSDRERGHVRQTCLFRNRDGHVWLWYR